MTDFNMTEKLQSMGIGAALQWIQNDPEKNLPKLLDFFDKLDGANEMETQRKVVRDILENKDGVWYQFVLSLFSDIDAGVRAKLLENFVINAGFIGNHKLQKLRETEGCNVPWAILMDPTSACNLNCTGCWAAEYGNALNMSYDVLSSIVTQAKQMGTYMFLFSGGEPLVRKKDVIRLCEEHNDCVFLSFTNGTLIDEEFADEMLRVKNFVPAISIEGFEDATDARRGKGTYAKVIKAMEILKRKKLPFGASCCYTSQNTEVIGSEAYIDDLIAKGCKFAWFFTYMPVGCGSPTELMARDDQRKFMYDQIRKFRETKPLFTLDFWNDGEYVQGCVAGGRFYCHINANGDIEPCAFIHYADSNVSDKTLLDAYKSPLFMEYHRNQPFNENHLRPCPLLDNKGKLAEMVHASGAHSTDLSQPENVDDLCAKCADTADRWEKTADTIWGCTHNCATCGSCVAASAPASDSLV